MIAIEDTLKILECPHSRVPLRWCTKGKLISADGGHQYPVRDGIVCFVPEIDRGEEPDASALRNVREYYETVGWAVDEEGVFADLRAWVDLRKGSLQYTHKCMRRLNTYFKYGGQFILDAGSGPIPHNEYLKYGMRFARRVCVDLSMPALRIAQSKLGDKGIYLQADLTSIPIKTGSMDAVTCNHVIYHVPADKQAATFHELWRVLRPGGIGVVVYAWQSSPIAWCLLQVSKLVVGSVRLDDRMLPDLYSYRHSLNWFRSQKWPFRYQIDTFRIVDNDFMQRYIGDGWFGQAMLQSFFALQRLFPVLCGKYGAYPAIVIFKD